LSILFTPFSSNSKTYLTGTSNRRMLAAMINGLISVGFQSFGRLFKKLSSFQKTHDYSKVSE
jgi:hypothetical protein